MCAGVSLMLNTPNEGTPSSRMLWCSPRAPGTDGHRDGFDGMLSAFVVSLCLTPPDIIRSPRQSEPRAKAFAPDLIIGPHYSAGAP